MQLAIAGFIGIMGLIIGSFLNVVIIRLHAGRQFTQGRSVCDRCGRQLHWWENIPLLSWLALRGRCHTCKKPIAIQHPIVEALTAALFVIAYVIHPADTLGNAIVLVLWLSVIASLIVLAVYDLRWLLLPDKVLLPIIAPAAAILVITAVSAHAPAVFYRPLIAAMLAGGGFYALAAVSKGRWMGGGDIKLVFVMGLLLGLQKTAAALAIAFLSAAIISLGLIALKLKTRQDAIPFGPFLIGAIFIAYAWGGPLIHWYLNISGLGLM